VFDFEQEILDHTLGKVDAAVSDQAANDEIAVPAVHFVELAARDDVGMTQKEQAFGFNVGIVEFALRINGGRERFNIDLTFFLDQMAECGRPRKAGWKIESGLAPGFYILVSLAVIERAGEPIPSGGNVFSNIFVGWGAGFICDSSFIGVLSWAVSEN
jgi:hypothetical protein